MRDEYDIFEKFPDGSLVWRDCVSGTYNAKRKLQELTEISNNQFYAFNLAAGDAKLRDVKLQMRGAVKSQISEAKKDIA